MERTMNCKATRDGMADLLLDRAAVPAAVEAHLAACGGCRDELSALQQTLSVLDTWETPEPSPYWMSRMEARLREEQRQAPQGRGVRGWLSGLRTRLWVSDHTLKPAGVAALGLLLAVCGGTWMDLALQPAAPAVQASNTVRDLQSINENAQLFQTLASLDGPTNTAGAGN